MKIESGPVKRRTWLGSVASVGVVVAGSIALAQRNHLVADVTSADNAAPISEPSTGYQLTEHVKRYYATARI